MTEEMAQGRMSGPGGWRPGTRGKRRLGTLVGGDTPEASGWVGVAGLARTVTERLIADGTGPESTDGRHGTMHRCLADQRHVLSGACGSAAIRYNKAPAMLDKLATLEDTVVQHGGANSLLRTRVATARAYVHAGIHSQGRNDDEEGWAALRSVLA